MKHITIIIPTRNRTDSLFRALNSIPKVDFITTMVVCDNDNYTHEKLQSIESPYIESYNTDDHIGSVACRNLFTPYVDDGLIYMTDDMEFTRGFNFKFLIEQFNILYPDDDGVLGITQNLPDFHPSGIALLGKKFIQRYQYKKVFNPDYWTFAAQEVMWLAKKIGKFNVTKMSVNHYHPAFNEKLIDQTHHDARMYKSDDMQLMKERESKGLIWGDSCLNS